MDKAPLEVICAEVNGMRSEFQVLCDRLDDNESIREFFGNWFKSIPDNLIAASFGDNRIKASPQYRALGPKVRRVADWALCPFDQRHLVKSWASVDDADDGAEQAEQGRQGDDGAQQPLAGAGFLHAFLGAQLHRRDGLGAAVGQSRLAGDPPDADALRALRGGGAAAR